MQDKKKRKEVRPPTGYSLFYKQAKTLYPGRYTLPLLRALAHAGIIDSPVPRINV